METREWSAPDAVADLGSAPGPVPAPLEPMRIVRQGWDGWRVPNFAMVLAAIAILLGAAADALGWMETPGASGRAMAGIAVLCAAAGVGLRGMLRWRHEYVLDADGVAVWRSNAPAEESEWTRIGWRDMAICEAVFEGPLAALAVVSGERRRITLEENPARPRTVEFMRRLVAEAGRHPRTSLLPLDPDPRGTPFFSVSTMLQLGGLAAFIFGSHALMRARGASSDPTLAGVALLIVLCAGLRLWTELDSSDIAYADRGARTWWRRTRNRLRRLLGIRHV